MLTINKEFRKGILFVRLLGELEKEEVDYLNKEITLLVKDMIITNVVINIERLDKIDINGINEILSIYEYCRQNNGISLLCGVNEKIKDKICNSTISCIKEVSNELKAYDLIRI